MADEPNRHHIWLVGGLDGTDESVDATLRLLRWFHTDDAAKHKIWTPDFKQFVSLHDQWLEDWNKTYGYRQ